MRVLFCGVRGSTPAPGPEFVRYGGHTSCVAVSRDGHDPTLVLDAGTGLQRLARELGGRPFRGTILLGHLHWDHTHGIPFFRAGDHPDAKVTLLIPDQGDAEAVLERAISPPHFPIRPSELRGTWRFGGLEEGEHEVEGFTVLAREIPHKGGRTFGYRVSDGGHSVAYLSDHAPTALSAGPDGFGDFHESALALVEGVDVLIHDAQYTAAEFPARATWGHSAIDYAVRLAESAGAKSLVLFHHDPSRTDDQLDDVVASLADAPVPVLAASEGMALHLSA
ncbi:MAG: MBL fold metallo-hydrolase [Acidimicrobiales bacterium]